MILVQEQTHQKMILMKKKNNYFLLIMILYSFLSIIIVTFATEKAINNEDEKEFDKDFFGRHGRCCRALHGGVHGQVV